MRDVGGVLLIWLIMWLFNRLGIIPPWTKDVVNGVVLVLLLLSCLVLSGCNINEGRLGWQPSKAPSGCVLAGSSVRQ